MNSPGLVVMGGDSCSKGREFESWHCTGWTPICCKICNVFEKTKIIKKEAGVGPFKLNEQTNLSN